MNEVVRPRCFDATDLETARQALARVLPVAENDLPWRALALAYERLGSSPAFAHSVGAALIVAGYAWGGELGTFDWKSSALMLYLALLSSAAFALWAILLKFNRVGMVSIFNFLIPVFGAVLSALFLGETILEWKNVAALALVCSGIWLVTKQRG